MADHASGRLFGKIEKLLAMTEDSGCTPAEAAQAALMARRLMASHDAKAFASGMPLDASPIVEVPADAFPSIEEWGKELARAVARAFRCKCYLSQSRKTGAWKATFLGHASDAEIARAIYEKLYGIGDRLGRASMESDGSTDAYHATTFGFLNGVERDLARQSVEALMPVPDDVEEAYEKLGITEAATLEVPCKVDGRLYVVGREEGAKTMRGLSDEERGIKRKETADV